MGGGDMSEIEACTRCGNEIPADAQYCAYCGRAVASLRDRIPKNLSHILKNISNWQIWLLVLSVAVIIGAITGIYLVNRGLYFPVSYAILLLVIGGGWGFLGWQWENRSNQDRFLLIIVIGIAMGLLIPFVKLLDNTFLSAIADSDKIVIIDIPGVHLEASGGYKRYHSVIAPPPYWLLTTIFGGLIGYLGYWLRNRLEKKPTSA
jgi:hypothetical protein